jgi:hypothetical protein
VPRCSTWERGKANQTREENKRSRGLGGGAGEEGGRIGPYLVGPRRVPARRPAQVALHAPVVARVALVDVHAKAVHVLQGRVLRILGRVVEPHVKHQLVAGGAVARQGTWRASNLRQSTAPPCKGNPNTRRPRGQSAYLPLSERAKSRPCPTPTRRKHKKCHAIRLTSSLLPRRVTMCEQPSIVGRM